MSDHYQEGRRGERFSGATTAEALDHSRGAEDRGRWEKQQGGGMVVAVILFSPLICAAYPITAVLTLGTGFLVSRAGPLVGIESSSGISILITLVALVAAFFGSLAVERRASPSKPYRILRWIVRLLLVPSMLVAMLFGSGGDELTIEHLLLVIIAAPFCYWLLKGLDRFVGATGLKQD